MAKEVMFPRNFDKTKALAISRGACKFGVIKDWRDTSKNVSYHFFNKDKVEVLYVTQQLGNKVTPIKLSRRWNEKQYSMLQDWEDIA